MKYTEAEVAAAASAMEKHRAGDVGEVGAALAVVGFSAERAAKETAIRDDMIRVAHRAGASVRQLADVAGLGRKTVTAIVAVEALRHGVEEAAAGKLEDRDSFAEFASAEKTKPSSRPGTRPRSKTTARRKKSF